ncbi:MAG: cytochrome c [Verrucomicrobia bacterium]|nr:cytochrome c [Cytophagales bacterium]
MIQKVLNLLSFVLVFWLLLSCQSVQQRKLIQTEKIQTDSLPTHFGFGRLATEKEITAWDMDVKPDGKGLPDGSGNAKTGRLVYAEKCAFCHGKTGVEGPSSRLVGTDTVKTKTIGNYWAYATTLYDYINRAMPFHQPGSLTVDEVYGLTAFLLSENKIIDSTAVMNARTLPKVVMPALKYYVPDDRKGGKEVR